MIINNLSFSGRETLLTKGVKSAGENIAVKAYEYVGAGKYFPGSEVEKTAAKTIAYKSPFELVNLSEDAVSKIAKNIVPASDSSAVSYAVSHGIPVDHVGGKLNTIG